MDEVAVLMKDGIAHDKMLVGTF